MRQSILYAADRGRGAVALLLAALSLAYLEAHTRICGRHAKRVERLPSRSCGRTVAFSCCSDLFLLAALLLL